MNLETENIDLSLSLSEIYRSIAFANTDGRCICRNDNDGNAVGLTDVDKESTVLRTASVMLSCRMSPCSCALRYRTIRWYALL